MIAGNESLWWTGAADHILVKRSKRQCTARKGNIHHFALPVRSDISTADLKNYTEVNFERVSSILSL